MFGLSEKGLCDGSVHPGGVRQCVRTCACARVRVRISVVQSLLTPSTSFGQAGKHFLKKYFLGTLFLAGLDLRCCEGFSLVAVSGGDSLAAVLGHLIAVAPLAELRLWDVRASAGAGPGLGSYGSQALEHRLNSYGTRA